MRYLGENCPYCGLEFCEGDDIVVCPECATPHHRACWFAHGDCANAEKHAEGFVWKKQADPEPEPEKPETSETPEENGGRLDIVCPDCGKVSPNGTLRCPDCGALLVPFNPMMGGEPPVAQFRPGFDAEEKVGDMKAGDVALFCRVGGTHYIKAFRKIAAGKKLSINWGAAFFSPFWFFYRKLYQAGAIFLALFVATSVWMMPASEDFYETYETIQYELSAVYEEGGDEAVDAAVDGYMPELREKMKPLYLPMAIQFALHVVAALIGDKLYYKKAKKDIAQARREKSDVRAFQLELFKRGGTSFLWAAACVAANRALLYLAAWLLTV
ncbi:MAG: DUF2628 domain-containing protein [Clostridia bacterium]|nr:DUF2628 domain-containing protein [Clostridia bacterium]